MNDTGLGAKNASGAFSAINGCAACVDSFEKTLRERGVSEKQMLAAVRIAVDTERDAPAVWQAADLLNYRQC